MPEPSQSTSVELKLDLLKRRSVQGVIALVSRQYILQGFAVVANILFGILLLPSEYGTYFLVLSIVSILNYFSDIGLAAALIQKRQKLTKSDLVTTFTVQQTLTGFLAILSFFATQIVVNHYEFTQSETYLYYALIASFVLASFKTIPSILLERELAFQKLIIPQILEHFVFYTLAVLLAWRGMGVQSFTIAVIARGVIGVIAIYLLKPWFPRFGFNLQVAKRLVSFGAPFQLNSLLALVKDDLLIAVLGGFLSRTEMGYITWAQKWTKMPLTAFLNSILTVTFPVFSRLQNNKPELAKAINKAIFFVSASVVPSVVGLMAISDPFFRNFPRFEKWLPATTAINYFGVVIIIASVSTILTNTLNSIGKVKRTLALMLMWITLTWTLTLSLINLYGFNGVAIAAAITSLSSFIVIPMVRHFLPINVFPEVLPALSSSALMYISIKIVEPYLNQSLFQVFVLMGFGAIIYLLSMFIVFGKQTRRELKSLKKFIKLKQP